MKLVNLFEYDRPKYTMTKTSREHDGDVLSNYINQYGGVKLGAGAFAIVYDKPSDVQTVIKQNKRYVEFDNGEFRDGYLRFILNVMNDPRSKDNPFLPQIFSVKINHVVDNLYEYLIEMEKLESLSSFDETFIRPDNAIEYFEENPQSGFSQLATSISNLTNLSPKDFLAVVVDIFSNSNGIRGEHLWAVADQTIMKHLRYSIRKVKKSMDVYITNKKFLEAIKLLKRHMGKSAFDLHHENIMVRRSPYGLQFVITDPFS